MTLTENYGEDDESADAILATEAESDLTLSEILSFSARLRTVGLQKGVVYLEIAENIHKLTDKVVLAWCETKQTSIIDFFGAPGNV